MHEKINRRPIARSRDGGRREGKPGDSGREVQATAAILAQRLRATHRGRTHLQKHKLQRKRSLHSTRSGDILRRYPETLSLLGARTRRTKNVERHGLRTDRAVREFPSFLAHQQGRSERYRDEILRRQHDDPNAGRHERRSLPRAMRSMARRQRTIRSRQLVPPRSSRRQFRHGRQPSLLQPRHRVHDHFRRTAELNVTAATSFRPLGRPQHGGQQGQYRPNRVPWTRNPATGVPLRRAQPGRSLAGLQRRAVGILRQIRGKTHKHKCTETAVPKMS